MPDTTMVRLTDEQRERLSDVRAHAAECGRLDCGHLARSVDRDTRRAVILYTAEGAGVTVDLDRDNANVAALVGVLRESGHARPTYVRGTTATGGRGYVRAQAGATVLPDATTIRLTPERIEVFTAMLKGMSASDISRSQGRARATVQSHAGWLRRLTGGHDATSCLVALVLAGRLSDPAMAIPAIDDDGDDDTED